MNQRNLKPHFSIFALAMFACALSIFTGDAAAQEYNPRDEFALTQGGANGLWNYGFSTSDTDNTLNLFSVATDADTVPNGCGGNFERWRIVNPEVIPQISRNNPVSTCLNVPTNAVFMHPGKNEQRAVLRFNAPISGTFQITGTFQKQALGATSDLKIIKNAATAGETVLYTGIIGTAYQQAFNFTVTIAAGDKIDFSVGDDIGSWNGDGTSIAVTIGQPITACSVAPANLQVNVPAENSPADVQSVNTNAQLVGDATYTNAGKVGRAFSFDGSGDYVRIEDNPAQRPATAVTAEGWFKFDSVSGIVSLVSKPLRGSALNSYTLYLEGGQLRGLIGNTSQFTRALSSFTPQTGVWHHLAFTYDLSGGVSTLKLYANGTEVTSSVDGTANLPITYDPNPFPLLIGGEYENNAPNFTLDGQADEVSVYGRTLAQTEIFDIVQQNGLGKCAPGSACATTPQSLFSLYKGDDSALDSRTNASGTLQGGTFANGKVGRAFNFDGVDDYVQTPVQLGTRATIETWVNPSILTGGYTDGTFPGVTRRSIAGVAGGFRDLTIGLYGGKLGAIYRSSTGSVALLQSNITIQIGVWYHVAVTIDGTTARLYVNGNLEASGAAANYTPVSNFRIGGVSCCANDNFGGLVDETSTYNQALTAAEIASIYNAGQSGKCLNYVCTQPPNNLVSLFAGDQNALDSRSNNHGALLNGATFAVGKVGQAFNLDGNNDYVLVGEPVPASLQIQNEISLNAWIYVTEYPTANALGMIVGSQHDPTVSGASIFLDARSNPDGQTAAPGHIHFQIGDGSFHVTNSQTAVPLNQWVHISANRKGGENARIYYNGILQPSTSVAWSGNITYTNAWFAIGQQKDINRPFKGLIDEVSIFNRTLAQSEVQSIVNADSAGMCKPAPLNPPTNRIAWFTGDGDTRDFLGLNPNGILLGDTNFRVGKVGQAFNLDGSGDYVEVADDADHRPATQLTAEGWFKFNNLNNSPHLIGKGLRGGDRNSYVMWFGNNNIRIGYSDSSTNFIFYDTGFVPNAGEFNHYAMVLNTDDAGANANTFKFYVNGREVYTNAAANPIFYDTLNPHPLTLGADINNDVPDFPLNGLIDEVSLYSRALSASEIAAIYNAGTTGKLKSVITLANLPARAKTEVSLAPTTVQLADATVTFQQITTAGTTSQSNLDLGSLPKLPRGATFTGLAYDVSTTAVYQSGSANDVQVCFNVPALQNSTFADLRILHLESGVWFDRTATGNITPNLCATNLPSLSPFVIVQIAPTSADVSVTGKVTDVFSSGLRNVNVTLTDSRGNTVYTKTNNFGNYRFEEVSAGELYVVSVSSKRYTFAVSSQLITVQEAVENVDFMGNEVNESRKPNR